MSVSTLESVTAAVAIGSNLGDRAGLVGAAVEALRGAAQSSVLAVASVIETAPVGKVDQPAFLNTALLLRTTLEPLQLLDVCQSIERSLGRDRSAQERWGPRTIDLDILLYGDQVLHLPGLHVPHERMLERGFVLSPLAQIAPELRIPGTRCTVCEALAALGRD